MSDNKKQIGDTGRDFNGIVADTVTTIIEAPKKPTCQISITIALILFIVITFSISNFYAPSYDKESAIATRQSVIATHQAILTNGTPTALEISPPTPIVVMAKKLSLFDLFAGVREWLTTSTATPRIYIFVTVTPTPTLFPVSTIPSSQQRQLIKLEATYEFSGVYLPIIKK